MSCLVTRRAHRRTVHSSHLISSHARRNFMCTVLFWFACCASGDRSLHSESVVAKICRRVKERVNCFSDQDQKKLHYRRTLRQATKKRQPSNTARRATSEIFRRLHKGFWGHRGLSCTANFYVAFGDTYSGHKKTGVVEVPSFWNTEKPRTQHPPQHDQ